MPGSAFVGALQDAVLATGADVDGRGVLGVECEHRDVEVQRVGQALPAAAAVGALVEAARLRAPDAGVDNRGVCGEIASADTWAPGRPAACQLRPPSVLPKMTETGCAGIRRRSADRDHVHSLCVGAEVRPGPGAAGVGAPDDAVRRGDSEDVARVARVERRQARRQAGARLRAAASGLPYRCS